MSRRIQFKLYKEEADLALAFERHCATELGIVAPLDELVKRQFLKFLLDNLDRGEMANVAVTGGNNEAASLPDVDTAGQVQPEDSTLAVPPV